ncbi:MAG TPA: hypothetical protein VHO25_20270, partial [Polyangiaceae bacterium]|nr:hypothetical protein [Polyangiaceae bacterium]
MAIDPSWHCRGGYCRTPEDLDASTADASGGNPTFSGAGAPQNGSVDPQGSGGNRSLSSAPDPGSPTGPEQPGDGDPDPALEDAGTSPNPDPDGPNVSSPGCTSNTECGTCQICGPAIDAGPRTCIPAAENAPCSTDNNSCTVDRCEGSPLHCVHRPIEGCDATCDEKPLIIADAVASSTLQPASNAIDGNTGTRWESVHPIGAPNTST